jgi:hypothetical protein
VSDRYEQFKEFVGLLSSPDDTLCFAFITDENGKKEIVHEFVPAARATERDYFTHLQTVNERSNVYLGMNPFRRELVGQHVGRTKENVAQIKRLYADADVNGDAVLERITASRVIPAPNVVLRTSPGKYQFIWNVDHLTRESAEPLLRAIAQHFNTDPAVAEIARLFRVPGLRNRKYSDAPEIEVVGECNPFRSDVIDFQLETKTEVKNEIPRDSAGLVPVGSIHPWMVSVAGRLRYAGLTPDEIEPILTRLVHEQCQTPPDGFADWKIRAVAQSSQQWEAGRNTDLILFPPKQTERHPATVDVSEWLTLFRSVDEMEDGPIVMVINGVLQEGVCFIGANPGDGKTLMGLALAKAISTGTPLFNLPQFSVPEQRTVIYLIPESRDHAFRKRCKDFQMPTDKMKFMARTISAGVPLELGDPRLLEAVRQTKPVVFLDTAARFMRGSDENAAAQNRELVNDVLALLAAGAVCVVLLHHATKASKQNKEAMTLENMLRGSSDLGAMCDQAYGIRKDMVLYANGSGPMEIDMVNLKDREQIGALTNIRLAASYKQAGADFPVSWINETGNFRPVTSSEDHHRQLAALVKLIKDDPNIPLKEIANRTGWSEYRIKLGLNGLGWHRVQGGKHGASPWHQDAGAACPYDKAKSGVGLKPEHPRGTLDGPAKIVN